MNIEFSDVSKITCKGGLEMAGTVLAACIQMCIEMGCQGADLAQCILKMIG